MKDKNKNPIGILLSAHDETEYRNRDLFYAQIILRQLTKSERDYFIFSMDRNHRQIASDLDISESAVSQLKKSIMSKLKLNEDEFDKLHVEIMNLFNDSTSKKIPEI